MFTDIVGKTAIIDAYVRPRRMRLNIVILFRLKISFIPPLGAADRATSWALSRNG